ncbi:MAG: hypothetical protein ABI723_22070 [Bacteroidia bacterium]
MPDNRLLAETKRLIEVGNEIITYAEGEQFADETPNEIIKKYTSWIISIGNMINKLYPTDNNEFSSIYSRLKQDLWAHSISNEVLSQLHELLGILDAIKNALENGLLENFETLVRAELFSNFLEMAEYFLNENLKNVAAILTGGVLEDSLRKLAIDNGLTINRPDGKRMTIDPLSEALGKIGKLTALQIKKIKVLADIRNSAAHSLYDNFTDSDVKNMIRDVNDFVTSYTK